MTDKNENFVAWLEEQLTVVPGRRAAAVARLAGISPGYLSALRKGVKKNPSKEVVERIAQALDGPTRPAPVSGSMESEPPPNLEGFDRMLWLIAHRRCPCCGRPQ